MLYIGIELGISEIKGILMEESGEIVRIKLEKIDSISESEGWLEQNPSDWMGKTIDCINGLLDEDEKEKVCAISFTGLSQGVVILDADDNIIRPAILSKDKRTGSETNYLNNVIGQDKVVELTGNIATTDFTATKLMWIHDNEYENYRKIRKIMFPKDYIQYLFTGRHVTDYSEASGSLLYDVKNKKWSVEMLHICEIREEWMPDILESTQRAGYLIPDIAEKLGLNENCYVTAGASDKVSKAIGLGIISNGECLIDLGKSANILVASDEFRKDKLKALDTFIYADSKFYLDGKMLSAISCKEWWFDNILTKSEFDDAYEILNQKVLEQKLGDNKLFFLPYLRGEKAPVNDEETKGAFIGITSETTKEDMLQAIYEGVAFALKDTIETVKKMGLEIDKITVAGEGAKGNIWKYILSNVFDSNIDIVEVEQDAAYGAAIISIAADGQYLDIEDAVDNIVHIKNTIILDPDVVEKYKSSYEIFKMIYPSLKNVYKNM